MTKTSYGNWLFWAAAAIWKSRRKCFRCCFVTSPWKKKIIKTGYLHLGVMSLLIATPIPYFFKIFSLSSYQCLGDTNMIYAGCESVGFLSSVYSWRKMEGKGKESLKQNETLSIDMSVNDSGTLFVIHLHYYFNRRSVR